MASKRELAIQLRAYERWNPENDPEKIADLEAIQAGIDEGRLVQLGRAVVRKNSPLETRDVTRDRFRGVMLGRALINPGSHRPISPGASVGDQCFIDSSIIDGDSVISRSTVINSSVKGSNISGSELDAIHAKDSSISDSFLSPDARKGYPIGVDNSSVVACELTNTPAIDAMLVNVVGSSGGRTIQGGPFYDRVLTSIGDRLFVEHIE